MIDTLKLSLTDYSVSLGADLDIQPSARNNATGEIQGVYPLWRNEGGTVEGVKAFHNGEDFNVTLKPMSNAEPGSIGCMVQFSVPKVAYDSNYHPTDHKGTEAALRIIEGHLKRVGIRTNIETASLSRVDLFKTVEAEEPYACYHPVLAMLRGKRMAKRDYGTTFLWGNTVQEICAYDKLVEMKQRKVSTAGLPRNSIRFEHRMLKGRKVRESLDGIRSVKDLLAGYDQVHATYREAMSKQLFSRSVGEIASTTATGLHAEMLRARDANGEPPRRYWFESWLKARGVSTVIDDLHVVREAVAMMTDNRATQLKINRKLDQAQMDAAAMKIVGPSKRPLGDLYTELKCKVLV